MSGTETRASQDGTVSASHRITIKNDDGSVFWRPSGEGFKLATRDHPGLGVVLNALTQSARAIGLEPETVQRLQEGLSASQKLIVDLFSQGGILVPQTGEYTRPIDPEMNDFFFGRRPMEARYAHRNFGPMSRIYPQLVQSFPDAGSNTTLFFIAPGLQRRLTFKSEISPVLVLYSDPRHDQAYERLPELCYAGISQIIYQELRMQGALTDVLPLSIATHQMLVDISRAHGQGQLQR